MAARLRARQAHHRCRWRISFRKIEPHQAIVDKGFHIDQRLTLILSAFKAQAETAFFIFLTLEAQRVAYPPQHIGSLSIGIFFFIRQLLGEITSRNHLVLHRQQVLLRQYPLTFLINKAVFTSQM